MHPIAFHLGPLTIHWYGVMIALAFLFGLWTATARARREKIPADKIADVTLWLMVGAIVGARIVYVTTYWREEFAGRPLWEIFAIWQGGLVYYGGLIGAIIAGMIYIRWKKLPLWKTADVLAPSIALGSFFGRTGCLLNGCCFGKPTALPWAIQFPNGSAPWEQQFDKGLVGAHDPSLPVHPTEIYDGLLNLALYAFLAWLFRRKKFDGQIFATYLICYAIIRGFVEIFRGDYTNLHYHFGLTPAQWIGVPIFIAGLALAAVLSRRSPPK
ncbi:MAG TPA: prolipoprotein diacylglyceryl transferase [Candidatus Baltobacteraceae bacterium]|nr:prolipoprotein diacylglyceryl transferase [Candidatus Baltobacteraceae bacterium]